MDPRQLYTLNEDVTAKLKEHRPVLVHQLDGFVDAGQAGRLFSAHLLEQLDHEVLATFDHDQLHDYRSRRPAMVFDTNQWKSYADLHLRLYRMVDEQGEVFLLLNGPEPDVQWERMAAADLAEQLDNLVFRGFLAATAYPRLVHLPRYLRAAQARLTTLQNNPVRDEPGRAVILRWEDAFAELCALAPPGPLPEFVDDVGWLLEELRVSLFAQSLRTSVPVSEKRVHSALDKARARLS